MPIMRRVERGEAQVAVNVVQKCEAARRSAQGDLSGQVMFAEDGWGF